MEKAKTLKEVMNDLTKKVDINKKQLSDLFVYLQSYIKQELTKNKQFNLFGLGKLVLVKAAARKGINPATGKKITIPASNRVKFRAGKDLKKSINK